MRITCNTDAAENGNTWQKTQPVDVSKFGTKKHICIRNGWDIAPAKSWENVITQPISVVFTISFGCMDPSVPGSGCRIWQNVHRQFLKAWWYLWAAYLVLVCSPFLLYSACFFFKSPMFIFIIFKISRLCGFVIFSQYCFSLGGRSTSTSQMIEHAKTCV